MNIKRIAVVMLAACILTVSAACGGGGEANKEEKKDNFNATGFPIAKEPITLQVGVFKSPDHGDFSKMKVITDYEKKTNIHIEWVEIPAQNYRENVNLMLGSGDYPEVFYGRGMEGAGYESMYGPSGVFMELTDLIDQYAPNVKKMFDTEPYVKAKSLVDGKLYSIPKVENVAHMRVEDKFYINQKWLDALKLQVPTTMEEFYTVMKAFKEQDPNGNGKPDEIPFTTWLGYYGLGSLYGPWGVVDNQFNHMMVKDGKLIFVPTEEGYKKGLEYWNRMYKDGLLFKESFTLSNEQLCALGQGPTEVLGSYIRHVGDYVVGADRYFDYTYQPPLKGPDSTQMWKATESPFYYSSCFVITNKCKYPKEAIRWIDYMFTEQGALEFNNGPENVTWKRNEDGTFTGIQPPEGVGGNEWRNGNCPGGYSCVWWSIDLDNKSKPDPADPLSKIGEDFKKHAEVYIPFQPKEYVPTLSFSKDEVDQLSSIQGSIFGFVKEWEGKFVTGQASLNEWDKYVKTLKDMGLEQMMKIYQQAYDRQMKAN